MGGFFIAIVELNKFKSMRTLGDRPSKKVEEKKEESSTQTESAAPQTESQTFDESVDINLG